MISAGDVRAAPQHGAEQSSVIQSWAAGAQCYSRGNLPHPTFGGTSPSWRVVLEAQGQGTMAAGREDGKAALQTSKERKSRVLYSPLLAPSPN